MIFVLFPSIVMCRNPTMYTQRGGAQRSCLFSSDCHADCTDLHCLSFCLQNVLLTPEFSFFLEKRLQKTFRSSENLQLLPAHLRGSHPPHSPVLWKAFWGGFKCCSKCGSKFHPLTATRFTFCTWGKHIGSILAITAGSF